MTSLCVTAVWVLCPVKKVSQYWRVCIETVQEPEIRDIRLPEIDKTLVFFPPHSGKIGAFCRDDLKQSTRDGHQVIARRDIEQRRNEVRVQFERSRVRFVHTSGG